MHGTTHVTAVIRDDSSTPATFRHYDNDSDERAHGTFKQITALELWTNCMLAAVVKVECELNQVLMQLEPVRQDGGKAYSRLMDPLHRHR